MRDNPGGGKSDPAEDVCRRCKKNSPFVLSSIGKRTRVIVSAKSRQFTADEMKKSQFL